MSDSEKKVNLCFNFLNFFTLTQKELPLIFEVSKTTTKWRGRAHLPWNFFPPNTDRFNAFAIHGTDVNRTYEALYPIPHNEVHNNQKPDL